MRRAAWLMLVAMPVFAQDARVAKGERIFGTSCSVPYCHGANGTAGRAPKLAGHSLANREVTTIVTNGIANKGMPGFGTQLAPDDLDAVIGYVMSLRGSGPASAAANPGRAAAVPDAPGKALFFDAVRMGGCGRCHELEKRGSRVAEVKSVPADLKAIDAGHTVTVTPAGEPAFPGFVVEQSERRVRVFDLSSQLPVLRTFAGNAAKVTPGSTWKHADAVGGYSDAELRQIAGWLQTTVAK